MGNLLRVARQAGLNGVIARRSLPGEVVLVRQFSQKGDKLALILISVSDSSIGNYEPTQEDLKATDWVVIAQSHKKIED